MSLVLNKHQVNNLYTAGLRVLHFLTHWRSSWGPFADITQLSVDDLFFNLINLIRHVRFR